MSPPPLLPCQPAPWAPTGLPPLSQVFAPATEGEAHIPYPLLSWKIGTRHVNILDVCQHALLCPPPWNARALREGAPKRPCRVGGRRARIWVDIPRQQKGQDPGVSLQMATPWRERRRVGEGFTPAGGPGVPVAARGGDYGHRAQGGLGTRRGEGERRRTSEHAWRWEGQRRQRAPPLMWGQARGGHDGVFG